MRITIIDKAEGILTVQFKASTLVESHIMSVCGMGEAETDLSLNSTPAYSSSSLPDERVRFGSFSIPVHTILQNTK
jgi:hypothetical protein